MVQQFNKLNNLTTDLNNPQILSYNDNTYRKNLFYQNVDNTQNILSVEQNREKISNLMKSVFTNIDEFPYIYFTSGVTHALDLLLQNKPIQASKDEYRYVFSFSNVTTNLSDIRYQSWPSSSTGIFSSIHLNKKIILDCSYIFASHMNYNKILPNNVSSVLIGFSKGHNLSDLRIGCIFSKDKIFGIHTLQYNYNYSNSIISKVLNNVEEFPLNYLYQKYDINLRNLYSSFGLKCFDTNLFGIDETGKRYPYWLLKNENRIY